MRIAPLSYRGKKRLTAEVKQIFQQDFRFFVDTVQEWSLLKRLAFCRDLLLKRV
jgi:hypothetical protein